MRNNMKFSAKSTLKKIWVTRKKLILLDQVLCSYKFLGFLFFFCNEIVWIGRTTVTLIIKFQFLLLFWISEQDTTMKLVKLLFYSSSASIYIYSMHYHWFIIYRDAPLNKILHSLQFFTIWNFVRTFSSFFVNSNLNGLKLEKATRKRLISNFFYNLKIFSGFTNILLTVMCIQFALRIRQAKCE